MAILSKVCKQGNFGPHNSLKLSFTNIRGLSLNFAECGSFLSLHYVRQTQMAQLILAISLLPLARDLSLGNSVDSYLCFSLALLHSVTYFFFLYESPSLLLCTVLDCISSNTDEILSVIPSANVFVVRLAGIIMTG